MNENNFNQSYKKKFILIILCLAAVLLTIQLTVEYIFLDHFLITDIILSIIVFMLIFHYYYVKDIEKTSLYVAYTFFISTLLVFFDGSYTNVIVYLWSLFGPIFIYYLLGFERGKKLVMTLLGIITVFVLLVAFNIAPNVLNSYALLQTYLAIVSFSLMAHFFQKMKFEISSTQKDQDNQKLKKLKARMDLALSINNAGVMELDFLNNSVYYSPQWKEMIGLGKDSNVSNTFFTWKRYIHPVDLKKIIVNLKNTLEKKEEYFETTHRLKHKNGEWIWVLGRGIIQYDKGIPSIMVGIDTNITKQKKIEQQLSKKTTVLSKRKKKLIQSNTLLKKAKDTAESATQTKSSFLANMSHEVRTPLNAINGFIKLLIADENDKDKLKYLETISNASTTLLNTINDILDFSIIESGKLNISKIDFNAYKEIMATVELFQAKAGEKNIQLSVEYDSSVPEVLYSDILRIKQVISNLFSNAVKFTPENGKILLKTKYKDDSLYISVTDNGIGIPKEKLNTIFNSFSQVDESTVRKYGGTGLGLTISAQLIEMLGGELKVKSTIDKGSTFFFDIPTRKGRLEKEEEETYYNPDIPLDGKVLVVEDIQTNQMFITLVLQKCGLDYDLANDGLEAIEKFKANKYDLILMDENMPNLNGTDATKQIRSIEKERSLEYTTIIALTANALVGDSEKFLDAGMDSYISKPVEPDVLVEMLHKYLEV